MKERVPLRVKPLDCPLESVLLVAVLGYGRENAQVSIKPLWFRQFGIGRPKWHFACDLIAILVNPRDGSVLFDARHEACITSCSDDPKLLDRAAREASSAVASAFPKII